MAGFPISTSDTGWIDIYALTGLAVGTNISIQNQAQSELVVDIYSGAIPAPESFEGYTVYPGKERIVDAGVAGCFARCVDGAQLYVQEL